MYTLTSPSPPSLLPLSRARLLSTSLSMIPSAFSPRLPLPGAGRSSSLPPLSVPRADWSSRCPSLFAAPSWSVRQWSHGVSWRSPPPSFRAQSIAAAPVVERFHRRIATMSTGFPSTLCFQHDRRRRHELC